MKRILSTLTVICLLCNVFLLAAGPAMALETVEADVFLAPEETIHDALDLETEEPLEVQEPLEAQVAAALPEEIVPEQGEMMARSSTFQQEEIDNPEIWYAVPDHVVTLAATPANTAYTRLQAAIQAAPANAVTHIIIPFHINVGNINTGTMTVTGVRNGATVVLIGNHPTAPNGQVVISDTHGGSSTGTGGAGGLTRTFRLRGDGTERSGLVLRNIILQNAAQAAASTPATPPAPLPLSQQTFNARGGGIAIEPGAVTGITGAGGGGHLILCQGAIIRNCSTDNNGPVDVQTDGRFTMMPGSEMHTNAAGNSGGAVHVNTRGTFKMYGGVIRDNFARGERVDAAQATQRAVGGAVFVQNGGTFQMYGGEIYENWARLADLSTTINATNAIVTSSGGGVFVTGGASSFYMYGGTIRDNYAERTRTSGLATGTGTVAVNNRNAYRAGNGGGVYLTGGATFHMYDGVIRNNTATNTGSVTNTGTAVNGLNVSKGGGVYLTGNGTTFTMHDGTILENQVLQTIAGAFRGGGGVAAEAGAVFEMYDGGIVRNVASALQTQNYQGGGGVLVGGNTGTDVARFVMYGGTITENIATYAGTADTGPGEGGGVFVAPLGDVTMYGGAITYNLARSNARGGGGVYVAGGRFTTANPADPSGNGTGITEKTIAYNRTRGHGGGLGVQRVEAGLFTSGVAGSATIVEGTVIQYNEAGVPDDMSAGVGLGGGVLVLGEATLTIEGGAITNNTSLRAGGGIMALQTSTVRMNGGEISDNRARSDIGAGADRGLGGGVSVCSGSTLILSGGKIKDNTANDGGGVRIAGGTVRMEAGEITGNRASQNGGGLYVAENSVFNGIGGSITDNMGNDGGGLFVAHSDLSNITIAPAVVFAENVARNGLRIDSNLAAAQRPRINPGTVSITGWTILDEMPTGSGNFTEIEPHAFTNYDINATGPAFWRVTHTVGENEGQVTADIGQNNYAVTSGSFVPDGAVVRFHAAPAERFEAWEIWTRQNETAEDGSEVAFQFQQNEATQPLQYTVNVHTHAIGNFRLQPTTTELTVSKLVTGSFGNLTQEFDFTIILTDSDGNPLPDGTQFNYGGGIIPDSGATAPADGTLTLDRTGRATFQLGHGQSITIADLPLGGSVQVVETADPNYTASVTDSEHADVIVAGHDTTVLPMAPDRTFQFVNERVVPPPTGLTLGNAGAALLLPVLMLLTALVAYGVSRSLKRGKASF